MAKRILIVEDEKALAALLSDYLSADGFAVETRADGPSGLEAALGGSFDLVLLDIMLPGMDGFEVCRALRAEKDVPVLIVSARREDGDKIRGLGLGADDYIVKPFSPAELVARVKSHLARYERLTGRATADRWVSDGSLEVNVEARRVRRGGSEVTLTAREFTCCSCSSAVPTGPSLVTRSLHASGEMTCTWTSRILPCTCEGSGKRSRTIPPSPGTSRPSGVWAIAGSRKDRIVEKVVLLQTPARHGQPPRA